MAKHETEPTAGELAQAALVATRIAEKLEARASQAGATPGFPQMAQMDTIAAQGRRRGAQQLVVDALELLDNR